MFTLLINTSNLGGGGGVQVALSFINECKSYTDIRFHVILGRMVYSQIDIDNFPSNFSFYIIKESPSSLKTHFKVVSKLKKLEKKINPDCTFTVFGPSYWKPNSYHVMGFALGHYLYPESPFFRTQSFVSKMKFVIRGTIFKYLFRKDAQSYIVETEDANQRLRSFLDRKNVHTVSNSYSSLYLETDTATDFHFEKQDESLKRLVCISSYYPHKNLAIINPVVRILLKMGINNFRFVLTLPKEICESVFDKDVQDYIENVGPISAKQCVSLYKACDFVFMPSLLETFSAVYPEGMISRKPILTSDLSFARYLCKDAALYFNPLDPEDISRKIIEVMMDESKQNKLINAGLRQVMQFPSAKKRANQYLNICINDSK